MSKILEIAQGIGFTTLNDIKEIKDDIIYSNVLTTKINPDGIIIEENKGDLYIVLTLDNKLGIDFLEDTGLLGTTGYIVKSNNLNKTFEKSEIKLTKVKGAISQEGKSSRYEEHIYMFSNEVILNGYCPIDIPEGFSSGIYIAEELSTRYFSTTLLFKISKTIKPVAKKRTVKPKSVGLFIDALDYQVLEVAYDIKKPVLLLGPTGSGKTTMIKELVKEKKKELMRINLNGEITKEDLIGSKTLSNGEVIWQDGPLTSALREGKIILLDEINAALPEVLLLIQALTEAKDGELGEIRLNENFGELITPHKDCRIFATGNPGSEYVGTKDFNPATLSRFIILDIGYLNQSDETKLLLHKFEKDLTPDVITNINLLTQVSEILRKEKNKEEIMYSCSTRDIEQVLELYIKGVEISKAYGVCIINKAQINEDKNKIKDVFISELNKIKGLKK